MELCRIRNWNIGNRDHREDRLLAALVAIGSLKIHLNCQWNSNAIAFATLSEGNKKRVSHVSLEKKWLFGFWQLAMK